MNNNIVQPSLQNPKDQDQIKLLQYSNEDDNSEQAINDKLHQNNQNVPNLANIQIKDGFKNAEIYVNTLLYKNSLKESRQKVKYHENLFWLRKQKQLKKNKQQLNETYQQTLKNFSRKDRQQAQKYQQSVNKRSIEMHNKTQKNIKEQQFMCSQNSYYIVKPKVKQQNAFLKAQLKNKQVSQNISCISRSSSKYTQKASEQILDKKVDALMSIICRQASQSARRTSLQRSKQECLRTMRQKNSNSRNKKKLDLEKEFNNFF